MLRQAADLAGKLDQTTVELGRERRERERLLRKQVTPAHDSTYTGRTSE